MPAWPIEVYFDYASPFAFLASRQLETLAERCRATLEWKPIQLSHLSSHIAGPPDSVSKRRYLLREAIRSAQFYEIPLQPPQPDPVQTETALLLALVCQEADIFAAYHREVFQAAWAHQRDISNRRVLADCLRAAGGDPKPLLDQAKSSTVKARLAALQVDAESKGIFGVPTMVLERELFWGADQLRILEWRIAQLERKRSRRRL